MKRLILGFFILSAFSFAAFAQANNASQIKTVEFISPIGADGKPDSRGARQNCFSFITETSDCTKVSDLYYGNLRSGNEWDWFQVMGDGSRNKIKKLGGKDWTDDFKVPFFEPYAKLKPGEQRSVVFGSGESRRLPRAVTADSQSSDVFPNDLTEVGNNSRSLSKSAATSDYKPFVKASAGNMYVLRVVDENNDFFVLFRVDELERGRRAKISWKKIPAPQAD